MKLVGSSLFGYVIALKRRPAFRVVTAQVMAVLSSMEHSSRHFRFELLE